MVDWRLMVQLTRTYPKFLGLFWLTAIGTGVCTPLWLQGHGWWFGVIALVCAAVAAVQIGLLWWNMDRSGAS